MEVLKSTIKNTQARDSGSVSSAFPHDRRQDFPYTAGYPIYLPPVSSPELQANNLHFTLKLLARRPLYINYFVLGEDIKAAVMGSSKFGLNR